MGITVVTNWQIVTVINEDRELVGSVLYADVVDDSTFRFSQGDYVCTSKIEAVDVYNSLVHTTSGSIYQLLEKGTVASIAIEDFELLRNGFSPNDIHHMNAVKDQLQH